MTENNPFEQITRYERYFIIRGGLRTLGYGLIGGAILSLIFFDGIIEVSTPIFTAGATLLLVSITAELIEENQEARRFEIQNQRQTLRRALLVELSDMEATLKHLSQLDEDEILLRTLPFRTEVYEANLDQIGILGSEEIQPVMMFYSSAMNFHPEPATKNALADIRISRGRFEVLTEEIELAISALKQGYEGEVSELEEGLSPESYHLDLVPPSLYNHIQGEESE